MITIEKEVNVVSLAAFLLSVSAIITQIYFVIVGPSPKVLPPPNVVFHFEAGASNVDYLAITAPLTYVNYGSPNSAYVVELQFLEMTIGESRTRLIASHYVQTNSTGSEYTNRPVASALPLNVSVERSQSKKVKFLPRVKLCNLKDDNEPCSDSDNFMKKEIFVDLTQESPDIFLEFVFFDDNGTKYSADCVLKLTVRERIGIVENGWVSMDCRNSKLIPVINGEEV